MSQPQDFEEKEKVDFVCTLERSLCGLKQSPKQWYKRFDSYVLRIGFKRSEYDTCLYYNNSKKGYEVYLLLQRYLQDQVKEKSRDLKTF